jgi:hypothetical protein
MYQSLEVTGAQLYSHPQSFLFLGCVQPFVKYQADENPLLAKDLP